MTLVSVQLSAKLLRNLDNLIREGKAENRMAAIHMAIEKYVEDQAVDFF